MCGGDEKLDPAETTYLIVPRSRRSALIGEQPALRCPTRWWYAVSSVINLERKGAMNLPSRLRTMVAIGVVIGGVLTATMPSAAIARVNLSGQRMLTSTVGQRTCHQYCRMTTASGGSRSQVIRLDSRAPFRWRDAGIGVGVGAGATLIAFGLTGILIRTRRRSDGRTVATRV